MEQFSWLLGKKALWLRTSVLLSLCNYQYKEKLKTQEPLVEKWESLQEGRTAVMKRPLGGEEEMASLFIAAHCAQSPLPLFHVFSMNHCGLFICYYSYKLARLSLRSPFSKLCAQLALIHLQISLWTCGGLCLHAGNTKQNGKNVPKSRKTTP